MEGQDFGEKITITGQPDFGVTDNFDVLVNGEMVHSKKQNGQGKAELSVERAAICQRIVEIIVQQANPTPNED